MQEAKPYNRAYTISLGGNLLLEILGDRDVVFDRVGPWLRPERDEMIRDVAQRLERPLVLNAAGINAVVGHTHILKARTGRVTILTPREDAFSRLTGGGCRLASRQGGGLMRGRPWRVRDDANGSAG